MRPGHSLQGADRMRNLLARLRRSQRRFSWRLAITLFALSIIAALAFALRPGSLPVAEPLPVSETVVDMTSLRAVGSFGDINDEAARSVALFEEAGRVIQHPRCMNCHPRTDRPTQTDAMSPHIPWVSRGLDGGGAQVLRCSSCHNSDNFAASGVPGSPEWKLAPIEMAWQGRTLGEICRQIQDPAHGGMTHAELLHHMAEDELVGWAWTPGADRTPAPGTQEAFGALIAAWIDTGARCPQ